MRNYRYQNIQVLATCMEYHCKSCEADMWKRETLSCELGISASFSTCCMQGKVQLSLISDPPLILQKLLTDDNERGKDFREHIRAYNSSLAFASLGVHRDMLPRQGPFTFRISGSVYHLIGNLYPNEDETPKFSQIYIHDSSNETTNRLEWNSDLHISIMQNLQAMLHVHSPYVEIYKHASEIISHGSNADWKLVFHAYVNQDQRRYNVPTTAEISVIIPGTTNNQPMNRDIVIYASSNSHPQGYNVMLINETHPKYDPLHNVLILPFGQQITDRPDGIVRAFHLKSKELINKIVHREIFGKVLAFVNVIEFQRGLPHLRMLIILHPSAKPTSPSDYDKFVSAEIPDPNLLPTLHQVVTSHMIHGPCGQINSPCMRDNKCTKRFPKEFSPCTIATPHGYPIYRRRDQHIEMEKHGAILDNRWIVPYNPYLSTKYQAHINVEVCSSVTAVKYLYKYVYKGHDRIIYGLQQDMQQYMYLQQKRIFHYDLHNRSPSIQRLAVHLPGRERVYYREGHATQAIQRLKDTTLTAWFKANDKFPEANHTPYHNFPEHFTWNATSCEWKPRKQRHAIGRLYQANPTEGERFYLRLLLHHVPGCKSFEDIRTLPDGTVCLTFQEAALKRGLLQDDQERIECLAEATISAKETKKADAIEKLLNPDQLIVYNAVIQAIQSPGVPSLFFLDGPGGTGKTFLYNTILARVRLTQHIALSVSSSGIAAELLDGSRTAHSRFKILIPILNNSTCNIPRQGTFAKLISKASIVIWDEAPMIHKHMYM
ncbi:uncharacterized protein LOC144433142 [Glandiceps talaboti]